jgi:hypothetical protein
VPDEDAPGEDGQDEDGVNWLASQLGDGTKPAHPDQFLAQRPPSRSKAAKSAAPAAGKNLPVDPSPQTAGFLWGLKPTSQTDPRPANTTAVPAAPTPVADAFTPTPAIIPAPAAASSATVARSTTPPTDDVADAQARPRFSPASALPTPELPAPVPATRAVPPMVPALPVPAASVPAPTRIIRAAADLEPAPWWTTPAQSPLVPTAEETAATESLRAPTATPPVPLPIPVPTPLPAPVSAVSRLRARLAPPAPLDTLGLATPPLDTPPLDTPTLAAPIVSVSAAAVPAAVPAAAPATAIFHPAAASTRAASARAASARAASARSATRAGAGDPAGPPAGPDGAGRRSSGRPPAGGTGRRIPPRLLWIGAGLLIVIVLVGLFFLGQRLVGGTAPINAASPSAAATKTPTPTPTPTPEPTGPQPVGVHKWNTLFGGECLQPYVSPWEEEFTVADCAAPHAAQMVYRGLFAGDATTTFPGEADLASRINLLCSAPGVIDLAAAGAFPDVQVQGSYPVTEEQWTSGPHYYYCFVSRSSGEAFTASVAGPGPAPAG